MNIKTLTFIIIVNKIISLFSWIWQHSDIDATFDSWVPNRPNSKVHNQDDCALMDCDIGNDCDWLDVSCYEDVTEYLNVSFICQKQHEEEPTTTISTTTTTFPG